MNEVSRLLGFSTAGTTKLIDRLCASGLVERRASPADRRVSMAEAGERAAYQAASVIADVLRSRFVGPLGEDRVAAMVESFALLAPAAPDSC
jgi:DNA-binding MarR family transcriptional regulator